METVVKSPSFITDKCIFLSLPDVRICWQKTRT